MPSTLEELRWKKFPCLDDGFVCLVDVMGDDAAVVQAARVSYGNDLRERKCSHCGHVESIHTGDRKECPHGDVGTFEGDGWAKEDRHTLRYLMRHRHTTPFEMAELKFLVRVPMDCWRQWIRHRTASVNEYSTRYTEAIDSAQKTAPGEWRLQATNNKQGSAGFLEKVDPDPEKMDGGYLSQEEAKFHKAARELYEERIGAGIAREQARKDLPLSTYTEAYWKIDLHNLLHFLGLRMDGHAQKEIREYATAIGEGIVKPLFPTVWEAFEDYRLGGMFLSRLDIQVTGNLHKAATADAIEDLREGERRGASRAEMGEVAQIYLPPYPTHFFLENHGIPEWQTKRCRERDECLAKLQRMGIVQVDS